VISIYLLTKILPHRFTAYVEKQESWLVKEYQLRQQSLRTAIF
jgi:uncharacterized HAD superfamily protein